MVAVDRESVVPAIKILFVIDYFRDPNAGTEGQLFQLIGGLDRTRFEPHLLVFRESDWMKKHGFPCDYTVLGCHSLKSPVTWFRLLRAAMGFKRKGIGVAHIFFNDPSIICPPVFRMAGIRSLISRRDMGYWYTPGLKKVLRFVRHFVDGVIVNSKAVRDVTIENEGYDSEAVHVIYNGYVDAPKKVRTDDLGDLRALRKNGVLLAGLVANVRPIKRIDDAVRALARLPETTQDVHLVHIGAGNYDRLEALATELGVRGRVHFLGPRSDVPACLELLDIGLLCSDSEGFSNAIVEYLRAGLPVVCSNVGGNPEAVVNGFNGYVYQKGDIDGLASALKRLVEDDAHRLELSQQARTDAGERFGLSAMVEAHQSLYSVSIGHVQSVRHVSVS